MGKRRLKIEDHYRFKTPSGVAISPDGSLVAYVVKEIDKDKDETLTNIYLVEINGENHRQLTFSGKDSSPTFSPDGKKLAFISSRGDKSQIRVLPLEGGESWAIKTDESVSGPLIWTPDGKSIIYNAEVFSHDEKWAPYPGAPKYDKERIKKLSDKAHKGKDDDKDDKKENKVKVITRFSYRRDGVGYFGDVKNQVFIAEVPSGLNTDEESKGRQITKGDYDHNDPSLSPDGKYIVVSSRHSKTADYDKRIDLWIFDIHNKESYKIYNAPGPSYSPEWSPCGNYITFAGHDNKVGESTTTDIWLLDVKDYMKDLKTKGEATPIDVNGVKNITRVLDRPRGGSIGWHDDKLTFLVMDRGVGCIYEVTPSTSPKRVLVDYKKSISNLTVRNGVMVYAVSDPKTPIELYTLDKDRREKQLTNLNGKLMENIALGDWDKFTYKSIDDQSIDGWEIYPKDFNPDRKYPLVLLVHGGPHGSYGPNFMFMTQLLAAEGYVVIYTNPRGSITYGQQFACSIDKNWGDKDYKDIMAGVDEIIKKGYIDEENMYVHGWSYGGYMSCWIATQTDRFKAICAGASVTNMLSGYGTSDITFADEYEYGGQPWKDYEHLIEHSAIGHVENVKTPMMLMHGENDLRVATGQTDEFYIALKRLGKEAIMVRYPDEFHGLSRPIHVIDKYERIISWFNYYRGL